MRTLHQIEPAEFYQPTAAGNDEILVNIKLIAEVDVDWLILDIKAQLSKGPTGEKTRT